MKLTMMCGLPSSGKSTKAAALARETGAALVTWDEHARRIGGVRRQNEIRESMIRAIKEALADGQDVVYDALNATAQERRTIREACAMDGLQTVCMYMNTPLSVCLNRDDKAGAFWTGVYKDILEPPAEDEGFDELIVGADGAGD